MHTHVHNCGDLPSDALDALLVKQLHTSRACSWQCGGREFDPHRLRQFNGYFFSRMSTSSIVYVPVPPDEKLVISKRRGWLVS